MKIGSRALGSACRDDRGESLVEFAISAVVLLVVLLSIMDVSRALYVYHFISYAAQEGTRYAVVRGSSWSKSCSAQPQDCDATSSDVQTFVQGLAPPGVTGTALTVSTTWPKTTPDCSAGCSACSTQNAPGCMVKVVVRYTFYFIGPLLPRSGLNFSSTSEEVIQE